MQNEPEIGSSCRGMKTAHIDKMKINITMDDSPITTVNQIEELIKVGSEIKYQIISKKERYAWLDNAIIKFRYFSLRKKDKNTVKKYLLRLTGFSDSQITLLIGRKKKFGKIFLSQNSRNKFPTLYTTEDIGLLIKTDLAHERLSGSATKRIFEREYNNFAKKEFERLSQISISHIYNLRGKRQYLSSTLFWQYTKSTPVSIGERRKPRPEGKPGFVRIDTVHQGDLDKIKGLYHINLVDEVTQWEMVASVERISEYFLVPVLEEILRSCPFKIINFHSDNGSEFINKIVAKLLNKLLIHQTKSRPRHSNDNGLVEGKNGSVIRKCWGRNFISKDCAKVINDFNRNYFNLYLCYHRPCGFATEHIDNKGKIKKKYDLYMTPYEKLKSLPNAEQFLKSGITFAILDKIANEKSDNEFAALMQKAKVELSNKLIHRNQLHTAFNVPVISGLLVD